MGHSMVIVDRTNVGDRLDQVILSYMHLVLLVLEAKCSFGGICCSVWFEIYGLMVTSVHSFIVHDSIQLQQASSFMITSKGF